MKRIITAASVFGLMALSSFWSSANEAGKEDDKKQSVQIGYGAAKPSHKLIFDLPRIKRGHYVQWDKDGKAEGTDPEEILKAVQSVAPEHRKNITAEVELREAPLPEARSVLLKYGEISNGKPVKLQGEWFEIFLEDWKRRPELEGQFGVKIQAPFAEPMWLKRFPDPENYNTFVKNGGVVFAQSKEKESAFNLATADSFRHDLRTGKISIRGQGILLNTLRVLPRVAFVNWTVPEGPFQDELVRNLDKKKIPYTVGSDNSLFVENIQVGDVLDIYGGAPKDFGTGHIAFNGDLLGDGDMRGLLGGFFDKQKRGVQIIRPEKESLIP